MNRLSIGLLSCVVLLACNPTVKLGKSDGIPSITGGSDFSLDNFTCGQPIASDGYTVTTTVQSNGDCLLTFENDVTVLTPDDYNNIPDFKGATQLVQEVDLDVTTCDFKDATVSPPTPLDLESYVEAATLSIDGQQVADKSTLKSLPVTVVLSGNALASIKAAIDARTSAVVHVSSSLLLPATPPPPKKIHIDYDAQPTIVLGTGAISIH